MDRTITVWVMGRCVPTCPLSDMTRCYQQQGALLYSPAPKVIELWRHDFQNLAYRITAIGAGLQSQGYVLLLQVSTRPIYATGGRTRSWPTAGDEFKRRGVYKFDDPGLDVAFRIRLKRTYPFIHPLRQNRETPARRH